MECFHRNTLTFAEAYRRKVVLYLTTDDVPDSVIIEKMAGPGYYTVFDRFLKGGKQKLRVYEARNNRHVGTLIMDTLYFDKAYR